MEKSLYKEYFEIRDDKKISDRVFMTRTTLYIVSMVLCLMCMAYSAYSLFAASESEQVLTAVSKFAVTATASEGCEHIDQNIFTIDTTQNTAPTDYQFTVTRDEAEGNAALGYCKIMVALSPDDVRSFYTEPIGISQDTAHNSRTVTLSVPQGIALSVRFSGELGSCALETIDDKIIIEK